jgi:hypothetical protein
MSGGRSTRRGRIVDVTSITSFAATLDLSSRDIFQGGRGKRVGEVSITNITVVTREEGVSDRDDLLLLCGGEDELVCGLLRRERS